MTIQDQYSEYTGDKEISLKHLILNVQDWFTFLKEKVLIILFVGLITGILGLSYAYLKKPIYTATTTFVLEDDKSISGLGNLAGLASVAGLDLGGAGGGIFQGENILGLYRSRSILEKTLMTSFNFEGKNELLIDHYIKFNNLRKKWQDDPKLAKLNFGVEPTDKITIRTKDSVINQIIIDLNKNYLLVDRPDKKVSMIQVDVKSSDEDFSKAFDDALVKNVNEFYINTKTKKTLSNVQILQRKTDSVRAVMNGAIYTAVAVTDATPNLNPTRQVQRVAPAQKAQFSAETNKSILSEMVKNLEMMKMSLLKETPLIQVIDEPVYPLPKQSTGKIKYFLFSFVLGLILSSIALIFSRAFIKIMT